MELTERTAWILPAVELNLCIRILGRSGWCALPMADTARPLERRMLDGFLHLVELGLLSPAPDGYRGTALMKARLAPVAWPERIIAARGSGRPPAVVYIKDGRLTAVEQSHAGADDCRVSSVDPDAAEELIKKTLSAAARAGGPARLEILDGNGECLERADFPDGITEGGESLLRAALAGMNLKGGR